MMTPEQRTHARAIIGEISAHNPYATFYVVKGQLKVKSDETLTREHVRLIKEHKPLILAYLTTPPPIEGQCRRGHAIEWKCSEHGTWLCACYFDPPMLQHVEHVEISTTAGPGVKDYWTNGASRGQGQGKKRDDSSAMLPPQQLTQSAS